MIFLPFKSVEKCPKCENPPAYFQKKLSMDGNGTEYLGCRCTCSYYWVERTADYKEKKDASSS